MSRANCSLPAVDWARVAEARRRFGADMFNLYSSLSSARMVESFRAPHLRQLVTRLDYNEWYKNTTKGDYNEWTSKK